MSNSKHTPGPWLRGARGDNLSGIPIGPLRGSAIFYIAGVDDDEEDGVSAEEIDANADLIAAAPDLLAACEWALRVEEGGRPEGVWTPYVTALRAAIAKAKGEAP